MGGREWREGDGREGDGREGDGREGREGGRWEGGKEGREMGGREMGGREGREGDGREGDGREGCADRLYWCENNKMWSYIATTSFKGVRNYMYYNKQSIGQCPILSACYLPVSVLC